MLRKKHHSDLLEANKSNLKKIWNILKGIVNDTKSNIMQEKFKLSDDTVTTDKNVISEKFIGFFCQYRQQSSSQDPRCQHLCQAVYGERIIQSIFLDIVTTEDINKVIGSLKKCSGI